MTTKATADKITLRLEQMEKELERGVERGLAQGGRGLKEEMEGISHERQPCQGGRHQQQIATLSRTVEQLSGQLINEAKHNWQQQELLKKIWKKVNYPASPHLHLRQPLASRGSAKT